MFFSALLSAVIGWTVAAVRETYRPARGRSTPLSVLARLPEHVARPPAIGVTACDEKEIGEPVDVFENLGRDAVVRLVLEFGDQPLDAPADGASEMQVRRGRAAAWQHEGAQRLQRRVEAIDLGFQPLHLLVGHREPRAAGPFALARRAQIGTDVEQIVLDARQRGIELGIWAGMQ